MEITKNPDGTPLKILTIEDEQLLREYMCDYLEDMGFETLQAGNGREGIEMIRNEKLDIVLTDLRMPEQNGLDVLAMMQNEYKDLPVIVISGTGTLQDVIQSMKMGAWDYILKPIHDYSIIELAVKRVIEKKQLIDENKRYRLHLEEEIERRTNELIKSNLRFKSLFNIAGDAIFIHGDTGAIQEVNRQVMEYTGYTEAQLKEKNMIELVEPSYVEAFENHLRKVTETGTAMFESVLKGLDDATIPVEVNACLVDHQSTLQILSICRNITERKKAELERKELEKQIVAAQKMESLGLLASGVAHDFNNVLSALNGYAQLIRKHQTGDSKQDIYAAKINDIIAMGKKLTERITSFIRKEENELVNVDIHTILTDVVGMLRPNMHNVTISLEPGAEKSITLGDATQLQNLFLNLGINARDAMPDGGTLYFTTSTIQTVDDDNTPSEKLRIIVKDTGIGMNDETLIHIFDPLFTTKERGKGTGLGLTSVLYCIKNLHGEIAVYSTLGSGTEFEIHLPLI